MMCPRCDGQGTIYKAKVIDIDIELNICDECEACWSKGQKISIEGFKDLSTLLEEYGITYKDAKIEIVETK